MGALAFSNNQDKFKEMHAFFEKTGFPTKFSFNYENIYINAYHKKNQITNNGLKLKNDDFIVFSGSLLMRNGNKLDLNFIYNNFLKTGLSVREKLIGNYLIVLKKGDNVYFFTDPLGIYRVYYSTIEDFCISTNIFFLTNCYKKLCIDINGLIEQAFNYGTLRNETIIQGIKTIQGNQIIEYNLGTQTAQIKSTDFEFIDHQQKDFIEIVEMLNEVTDAINYNYNDISIYMTGGLDSRLLLASLLDSDIKPSLLYGISNSRIISTKEMDKNIVQQISQVLNLKIRIMDWSKSKSFFDDHEKLLLEFGEYFFIYGGIKNVFHEVSKQTGFVDYGYFGEIFRNNHIIDLINKKEFNIDDLISIHVNFGGFNISSLSISDKYINTLKNKYTDLMKELKIKNNYISLNQVQLIDAYRRISKDTYMLNLSNQFCSSFTVLGDYNIFRALTNCDYFYKKGARLQLRFINRLFPKLLHFPIYSHNIVQKFDSRKKIIKPKSKLNIYIRDVYNKLDNPTIKNYCEYIYFQYINTKENQYNNEIAQLRNFYSEKIDEFQDYFKIDILKTKAYSGSINGISNYYHYLFLLHWLSSKRQIIIEFPM